jgi:hypothetical protein
LKLQAQDQERLDLLLSRAQTGELTDSERTELEQYRRVADRLAALQSRAKLWLDEAHADEDAS